jgi:hypothetical protein
MIVAQPHSGVNPVTIYERRGPGEYTAKVTVTIISLLHDFMQLNPNLIELYDIGIPFRSFIHSFISVFI